MGGYAVLDFETTGFSARQDRIIEVGLVLVSSDGKSEGEWCSLVNPGRDVGPTEVHGITAREVLTAPTFAQLLPRLLDDIRGRIITTHNLAFDLRFLSTELQRAGVTLSNPWVSGLCTMKWSGRLVPAASRKLSDCCDALGIRLDNAHSALHDARATAALLAQLMRLGGTPAPWDQDVAGAAAAEWPDLGECSVQFVERNQALTRRPAGWLDRIVARLPLGLEANVSSYLAVLESALLDGYLSQLEEDALVEVAQSLGLDRAALAQIHRDYLRSMAAIALADGVLTAGERADLAHAADLLGLTAEDVEVALTVATGRRASAEFTLTQGDVICLTGAMTRPRGDIERDLGAAGLVAGPLTKRTRVLVAADPDSASGKAKKARDYGVPIVREEMLSKLLAAGVQRAPGQLRLVEQ